MTIACWAVPANWQAASAKHNARAFSCQLRAGRSVIGDSGVPTARPCRKWSAEAIGSSMAEEIGDAAGIGPARRSGGGGGTAIISGLRGNSRSRREL